MWLARRAALTSSQPAFKEQSVSQAREKLMQAHKESIAQLKKTDLIF